MKINRVMVVLEDGTTKFIDGVTEVFISFKHKKRDSTIDFTSTDYKLKNEKEITYVDREDTKTELSFSEFDKKVGG